MEAFRRARHLSLAECLEQDYQICHHMCRDKGDFFEGVRATLIDKSKPAAWKFGSVNEVRRWPTCVLVFDLRFEMSRC